MYPTPTPRASPAWPEQEGHGGLPRTPLATWEKGVPFRFLLFGEDRYLPTLSFPHCLHVGREDISAPTPFRNQMAPPTLDPKSQQFWV